MHSNVFKSTKTISFVLLKDGIHSKRFIWFPEISKLASKESYKSKILEWKKRREGERRKDKRKEEKKRQKIRREEKKRKNERKWEKKIKGRKDWMMRVK